ncbi:transglutaminase-like cysteine peptidase [Methylobacterium sp. JK268]
MVLAATIRVGAAAALAAPLCLSPAGPARAGKAGLPGAVIPDGPAALAPFAYLRFCQRSPGDCAASQPAARVELTPERMRELAAVNRAVNGRIAPRAQLSDAEAWSLTGRRGNCNTFALQKRHELRERGWPLGALSLAVVSTQAGVGHLVLVVRGTTGDLVLDNLREDIRSWSIADYRWHKIQAAGQPENWVEIPSRPGDFGPRRPRAQVADALAE